ncbi:MAG: acetylornithine deacetylase/succinyl-diaminopimelate desuccinylase-like protein [Pseudohongiellaceae bacterium]|jgi:acetylornithine deacetylase/succinyl-diaminopimelate desuccinylase-like protein
MSISYIRQPAACCILASLFLFSANQSAGQSAGQSANYSSTDVSSAVNQYRADNEKLILNDFIELLAMPNVASNLADMTRNADFIESLLSARDFSVKRLQSGGSPYIFAELATPGAIETILLYAHYDGQPVQAQNWTYPPFTPTLLDRPLQEMGRPVDLNSLETPIDPEARLYARSAGDDKMPIIAILHALDALKASNIPLSVNIKLLFDGEEERGSPTLGRVIDENPELFNADLLLFCDAPMHQSRTAQLVFGVRGGQGLELTTYGANRPLHSGHYGNWAPNPVMRLAYLLTTMRDESGRILIDDFYDQVAKLTETELTAINAMPDVTEQLKNELSIHTPEGSGMRLEQLITLPALNVRGLVAGGVGSEGRNIILATATVSLDMRLVPNQNPATIRGLVEEHIQQQGFFIVYDEPSDSILRSHEKVIKLDWRGTGGSGLRTSMDSAIAQRLIVIMRQIAPDLILTPSMGGGLPLTDFSSRMDTPIVVLPLANHDNNQHAENENIRIQNLWDAMSVYGVVLSQFGKTQF